MPEPVVSTEAKPKESPSWPGGVNETEPIKMPDYGPRYKETPADPYSPTAPTIAEPWNAVSATLFIFISIYWLLRLRGQYRRYPVLVSCLPILLVGGIGGTLYHGLRTHWVYLFLDVVPIQLLGTTFAVYLYIRLGRHSGWRRIGLIALGLFVFTFFLNGLLFRLKWIEEFATYKIALNYLSLGVLVCFPLYSFLSSTSFRYLSWVLTSLIAFGMGLFFRQLDATTTLEIGTHWLWHTFGAISTMAMIQYFHCIEGRDIAELARPRRAAGTLSETSQ